MARETRSVTLQVTVTPSDAAAIKAAADRDNSSVSDYLREAVLLRMVLDRNPHGFKAVGRGLASVASDLLVKVGSLKTKAA